MKELALLLCLWLHFANGYCQLYDAQWAFGSLKPTVMDVKNDTAVLVDSLANVRLSFTAASICDPAGNLLFASNGFSIYDKYGHLVENGDSISPCAYSNNNSAQLPITQCVLFIPMPDNDSLYYLFHYSYDTLQNTRPNKFYYSLLNAKANNGLGKVIDKNNVIYSGAIFSGCRMTATKHANGRDWWLIRQGWNNNFFYKFLVTKDSIYLSDIQAIGPNFQNGLNDFRGQCKFSLDGSMFATIARYQKLLLMDFDRCSGEFSNPRARYNNSSSDPVNSPITGGIGLEFSSNGEFIYTTTVEGPRIKIAQYEVNILGMAGDSVMMSYVDTANADVFNIQMGYNGKVYAAYFHGTLKFIHIINKPDLKGMNCDFVYLGQPTYSLSSKHVPNLIAYRLGALAGSGCDTISTASPLTPKGGIKPRVFPNPVDKAFYIEMPQQGDYVFEMYNEQGRLVEKRTTKQVDIINVEQLQSGVYFLSVKDKSGKALSTMPVIVQH